MIIDLSSIFSNAKSIIAFVIVVGIFVIGFASNSKLVKKDDHRLNSDDVKSKRSGSDVSQSTSTKDDSNK